MWDLTAAPGCQSLVHAKMHALAHRDSKACVLRQGTKLLKMSQAIDRACHVCAFDLVLHQVYPAGYAERVQTLHADFQAGCVGMF